MWHVVTGCSGFIGRHLANTLLERGEAVRGVDKRRDANLERLVQQKGGQFEVIWGDLAEPDVCAEAAVEASRIYHLAAETDLGKSVETPADSLCDDLVSTVNILEAARAQDEPPRVVIASSAAVYGTQTSTPAVEGFAEGATILSPYGIHKRSCEMYADMYSRVHGLSTVCLRYFNVYGPGQVKLSAVIPAFVLAMLRKQPLTIRGDGCQSRDFVHVSDVVEATLLMAEKERSGTYNVGTGQSVSLVELIEVLEHVRGRKVEVVREDGSNWDIRYSCADIGAMRALGWAPTRDIVAGLVDTIEYYRQMA